VSVDELSTLREAPTAYEDNLQVTVALTVAAHPDLSRVGDRVFVEELEGGMIARGTPAFRDPRGTRAQPLGDRKLSRKGVSLLVAGDGSVRIERGAFPDELRVDGAVCSGSVTLSHEDVARGVAVMLAERIVLVVHRAQRVDVRDVPELGMVGESDAILLVRSQVLQVADLMVPVLIRGASGTGKELVAHAIHTTSERAGPFQAVSMAAIPSPTAASELFGHVKGAFTGAVRDQPGHFRSAQGGTLFLDEIADAPIDVQASLLRVLETREVTPVGGQQGYGVDVRLVAATDTALEEAIAEGGFRLPLFHRLTGYQIHVPPLAERRDDIGRLLVHWLREELGSGTDRAKLAVPSPVGRPWLGAGIVEAFVRYSWPGNVRQLRNAARHLVVAGRRLAHAKLDKTLQEMFRHDGTSGASPSRSEPLMTEELGTDPPERPAELTDAQLRAALRDNHWQLAKAAKALGIARSSLYRLVDGNPAIRQAKDITREQLVAAVESCDGDSTRMSVELEVSAQAIKLRMKELGLDAD